MTYNYPTPKLISQYMSVSIEHILLKLQIELLKHHLTVSHLLFIHFCYYTLFMYSFFNAFCHPLYIHSISSYLIHLITFSINVVCQLQVLQPQSLHVHIFSHPTTYIYFQSHILIYIMCSLLA
jgi:hypothetical protein